MTGRDVLMTIGDFSRASRLSAKALRFYHDKGVLAPASVDPDNGYRLYAVEQIADAQVIRALRDLDVPLGEIRDVLSAPDATTRAAVLAVHADRLEGQLRRTRESLGTLRRMLTSPPPDVAISYRQQPATTALGIERVIDRSDLGEWFRAGMAELRQTAGSLVGAGPYSGLWSTELFVDGRGPAALYVPVADDDQAVGRGNVRRIQVPAAQLAVATSVGPDENVAAAYAALGGHVARHELGIDAPIRESYLRGLPGDPDAVVEIGWPIFRIAR